MSRETVSDGLCLEGYRQKDFTDQRVVFLKGSRASGMILEFQRTYHSLDFVTFLHVILLLSVGGVARQYYVFSYVLPHLPSSSPL
jgi:hypothetical protein